MIPLTDEEIEFYEKQNICHICQKEFCYNKNEKKLRKLLKYKIFQNISKNDLVRAEELQNKSIDELRGISKLRGKKPKEKLTKEDLIFSLLKSESSSIECNCMKYFNNRTNDDSYDDKIKSKINDIRLILGRLGNIASNKKKTKKRAL